MRHVLAVVGCLAVAAAARAEDPQALADRIDARLDARLKEAGARPAPPADDSEFLRRAYLDLSGRIPAPREVYDFLADARPDKRGRLVDDLLESPRYAAHLAAVWRALLLPEAAADGTARVFQPGFEAWLRERLRANDPYDRLVRDLIAAPITADRDAPDPVLRDPGRPNPLAFFAVKEANPGNLAAATARVFLGVQIECAQCHNHPFAHWRRDQFWNLAAFYAGVERHGDGLFAPVSETRKDELPIPDTARRVRAAFLDGKAWAAGPTAPRTALAAWVTAADNPFFRTAAANRVWGHLFGVGLVDPVDDFHDDNPPSHPELLDDLGRAFADNGFDLKHLIRAVARTRAYQRTSARTHPTQDDPRLYARMAVKGLTGEQLFDSLARATGHRESAGRGRAARDQFLTQFAPRGRPTEPEMSITQALTLMNGRLLNQVTSLDGGPTLVAAAETPGMGTAARIEVLYVAALGRKPTAKELDRLLPFVDQAGTGKQTERLADIFWILLNTAEFRLNH